MITALNIFLVWSHMISHISSVKVISHSTCARCAHGNFAMIGSSLSVPLPIGLKRQHLDVWWDQVFKLLGYEFIYWVSYLVQTFHTCFVLYSSIFGIHPEYRDDNYSSELFIANLLLYLNKPTKGQPYKLKFWHLICALVLTRVVDTITMLVFTHVEIYHIWFKGDILG